MTAVRDHITVTGRHADFMHHLSRNVPYVFIRTGVLPNPETYESVIAALQPPVNHEVVSEYQNGTPRAL